MSNISIVAGPPGIGKSTYGQEFVDPNLEILKKDEIIAEQKSFGFRLHEHIAISKFLNNVNGNLNNGTDLALEITMCKPHHYDFVGQLKNDHPGTKLNLILFYTDDLQMCKERAETRFASGGHEVKPEMLETMFENTLPLLKSYFNILDKLTMINVTRHDNAHMISNFEIDNKVLASKPSDAIWFNQNLRPFLQRKMMSAGYSR